MDDFSTPGVINYYGIPSSPSNFIKPGKRPMSSMTPTIFTDENSNFILGLGAAGGSKITLTSSFVRFFLILIIISFRVFIVSENFLNLKYFSYLLIK